MRQYTGTLIEEDYYHGDVSKTSGEYVHVTIH